MLRWGRCASCWCCVGCSYRCRRSSAPFSGPRVLKVCLIRVSLRVSPRQSRADSRCAGCGYTAGVPARPLSARGTTVLTLRNTAMDTTRRLGGIGGAGHDGPFEHAGYGGKLAPVCGARVGCRLALRSCVRVRHGTPPRNPCQRGHAVGRK